jgi:general L-amino acid transport system substrate-binding protein
MMKVMKSSAFAVGVAALVATALSAPAAAEDTIGTIKQRGELVCGVDPGVPGYSMADANGNYQGLDIDLCKGVATAILGDGAKIKYVPLSTSARFAALQSGEIDVLIRDSSWTFSRNTKMGLQFTVVNFFTGDGFLVKKSLNVKSARELDGATVCAKQGTATEINVQDYAAKNNIKIKVLNFEKQDEVLKAFIAGRCDVYSDDTGSLAGLLTTFEKPDDYVVLPEVMLGQYLGPVTRQGDEKFTNVVRWTHYVMVSAEEFGITQANVDEMRKGSNNPEVRRMLGIEDDFGAMLGLDKDWAYRIVKLVGNYGESYDRNFGAGSKLKLGRGLNKQWYDGGLMWAPRWN